MPFEPHHAKYNDWLHKWKRQRDVIEGEDAVKAEGETYLPKLDGQGRSALPYSVDDDRQTIPVIPYGDYKQRANFVNMTARTVESLAGAILRKEPSVKWPEKHAEQLDGIGYGGSSFYEMAQETLDDVIGIGRHGHLVDAPDGIDNAWPFLSGYAAEAITNWDEDKINGKKQLVMVVLEDEPETVIVAGNEKKTLKTYRRLNLGAPVQETEEELKLSIEEFLWLYGLLTTDFKDGPIYFQEIWQEKMDQAGATDKEWVRIDIHVPRMWGGRLLTRIPFVFFNPSSTKPNPSKPPLMDLSLVNLSHYRNSADLEHGLHFTGLPQPWAAGFDFKGDLYVGSSVAWVSREPNARAGYLEFSGAGLSSISEAMEAKKREAAVLGARILEEQQTGGAEAAETVRLRHGGEQSVLAKISMAVSEGLSKDLEYLLDWVYFTNPKENGSIALNKDFNLVGLSPQMLQALMLAVQSGKMSWQTYFWNLKRGEVVPEERTEEEEYALIQQGTPSGNELPKVDGDGEGEEEETEEVEPDE